MAPEKRKGSDQENPVNSRAKKQKLSDGWDCQNCTYKNSWDSIGCHVCGEQRSINPLEKDKIKHMVVINEDENSIWNQLVDLEMDDVIINYDTFECPVCFEIIEPGDGVCLRECLHSFCRPCLQQVIKKCEEAEVLCPYVGDDYSCRMPLQHREIRSICTIEEYNQYLTRSITIAENMLDRTFHCLKPDCIGWCEIIGDLREFFCPVCGSVSCMNCNAMHNGMNCAEFQNEELAKGETLEFQKTKKKLNSLLQTGEAMRCPKCNVIIVKNGGCTQMKCRMCKKNFVWDPQNFKGFGSNELNRSSASRKAVLSPRLLFSVRASNSKVPKSRKY